MKDWNSDKDADDRADRWITWGAALSRSYDCSDVHQRILRSHQRAYLSMDRERAARSNPWWFGHDPGHDDIAVACTVRHILEAFPGVIEIEEPPALSDHCLRAEARPDFRKISQPFLPPQRTGG